ncbi:MAG TPA: hypothetical protein VGM50_03000 [Gemmatimonadaceae bacterium]
MRISPHACVAIVVVASGCASSKSQSDDDIIHIVPQATQRSPNLLTAAEIESSGTSTALQAVQRLRPNFLVVHGGMSRKTGDPGIVVYMNGTRLGDTSTLSSVTASEVKTIEYLNPNDATQRFGGGHTHGAIIVTRK